MKYEDVNFTMQRIREDVLLYEMLDDVFPPFHNLSDVVTKLHADFGGKA
jgi:hypothetical protein